MALEGKRFLALIDNFFFAAKVEGAARHLGLTAAFVRQADQFRLQLRDQPPALIIVDLACASAPWEELVRQAKSDPETAAVPVLAFGRHTDGELFKRARNAGCDKAVTNAHFSEQLAALLTEYLGEDAA